MPPFESKVTVTAEFAEPDESAESGVEAKSHPEWVTWVSQLFCMPSFHSELAQRSIFAVCFFDGSLKLTVKFMVMDGYGIPLARTLLKNVVVVASP